jgi:cytochrome c biogenesis protein CcdA
MADVTSVTALWWAVIFSGLYHGINPGMGWPLAVSAALMERNRKALPRALAMLAAGHFVAMIAILLPFSLMIFLVEWETQIRIGAGILVIAMGIYLLINRRHPKFLARVHPARLALWSFLAAMAHGAGLMLVPIFLGICAIGADETGHLAAQTLMGNNIVTALSVAAVHTLSMTVAGGTIAVIIYFWLGLKFISRTWFNLDLVWAISLVLVGVFGIYSAYFGH